MYKEQKQTPLVHRSKQRICDNVYVSLISGLSLAEYVEARSAYCSSDHADPCSKCERLLLVAMIILEQSYCTLAQAFRVASPDGRYTSEVARRLLLQMPLVSVRIGNASQGNSFSILMEKFAGTDYRKLGAIINSLAINNTHLPKGVSLEKSVVKMLLSIAQSDQERECLRYAIYKASGMTPSQARRTYGFEGMQARSLTVEATITEIQQIRQAIEDLACIADQALLTRFGIPGVSCTTSSESEEEDVTTSGYGPAPVMDVRSPLTQDSGSEQGTKRPRTPPPGGYGPAPVVDVRSPLTQASGSEQGTKRPRSPPSGGYGPAPVMDVRSPLTQASGSEQGTKRPRIPPPGHQMGKDPYLGSYTCTASWNVEQNQSLQHLDPGYLQGLLKQSKYNWFELVELLEDLFQNDISGEAESVFTQISKLGLDTKAFHATEQSYFAYRAIEKELYEDNHTDRALNGEVVSDRESDDPGSYVGITDPFSAAGKELVRKKRVAIYRRARRKQAKAVAERRFFSRKLSNKTSKILTECPGIGKEFEIFVQSHNIGADAWRRTGVLTFDGNLHVKEKVTYERVRKHLEEVYKRKISYGTVIQMCVARNKRRRSAKNYRGIAKVTSRRARKGFNLTLSRPLRMRVTTSYDRSNFFSARVFYTVSVYRP